MVNYICLPLLLFLVYQHFQGHVAAVGQRVIYAPATATPATVAAAAAQPAQIQAAQQQQAAAVAAAQRTQQVAAAQRAQQAAAAAAAAGQKVSFHFSHLQLLIKEHNLPSLITSKSASLTRIHHP